MRQRGSSHSARSWIMSKGACGNSRFHSLTPSKGATPGASDSHDAWRANRAARVARQELPLAPPHLARFAEARIEQAEKYETILARFGRFPFRNAGLGRPTTTDERVFLADFVAAPNLMRQAASF